MLYDEYTLAKHGFKILSPILKKGATLNESAASTYTDVEISMPSQPFHNRGVCIRGVQFHLLDVTEFTSSTAENAQEYVHAQITEEEETAMLEVYDENLIAEVRKQVFGTIATGPANSVSFRDWIKMGLVTETGILVPPEDGWFTMAESIWAAVKASDSGSARGMRYNIFYHLVELSDDFAKALAIREAYET